MRQARHVESCVNASDRVVPGPDQRSMGQHGRAVAFRTRWDSRPESSRLLPDRSEIPEPNDPRGSGTTLDSASAHSHGSFLA